MIFERKCNVVVMLLDFKDDSSADIFSQYWPQTNSCCYFKEFTVTTEGEEVKDGFNERVINVENTKVHAHACALQPLMTTHNQHVATNNCLEY